MVVPPVQASQSPPRGNAIDGEQAKDTGAGPALEVIWMASVKVTGAAPVGRLMTCEVGEVVRDPVKVMVALVELVIAGVMPLVVATATASVQLANNPIPLDGLTVKLSGVAAVERLMVEVAGATVQGPELIEAVTVAGRVVGLAGIVESAAVVVQTTLVV